MSSIESNELYSVVKFRENNELLFECIPDIWFTSETKTYCFWPPPKGRPLYARAIRREIPDNTWEIHHCEVVRGELATYSVGRTILREKCQQSYNTSSSDDHKSAAKFRRRHPVLSHEQPKSFDDVFTASKADGSKCTEMDKEKKLKQNLRAKTATAIDPTALKTGSDDLPAKYFKVNSAHSGSDQTHSSKSRKRPPISQNQSGNSSDTNIRDASAVERNISRNKSKSSIHGRSRSNGSRDNSNASGLRRSRDYNTSKSKTSGGNRSRSNNSRRQSKSSSESHSRSSSRRHSKASSTGRSRCNSIRDNSNASGRRRSRDYTTSNSKTSGGSRSRSSSSRLKSKSSREGHSRSKSSRQQSKASGNGRSRSNSIRDNSNASGRRRSRDRSASKSKTSGRIRSSGQSHFDSSRNKSKASIYGRSRSSSVQVTSKASGHRRSRDNGKCKSKTSERSCSRPNNSRSKSKSSRENHSRLNSRKRQSSQAFSARYSDESSRSNNIRTESRSCSQQQPHKKKIRMSSISQTRKEPRANTHRQLSYGSQKTAKKVRSNLGGQKSNRQMDTISYNNRRLPSHSCREQHTENTVPNCSPSLENKHVFREIITRLDKLENSIYKNNCQNDRRLTRMEVTINKTFIRLGDISQPNNNSTRRTPEPSDDRVNNSRREFRVPDFPIMSMRELTEFTKKLKNPEFNSFLVGHEGEFCTPSKTKTNNVVMTAYLRRFISLDVREGLTFKDPRETDDKTLYGNFHQVYLFLVDVMRAGYQSVRKSITVDEAHLALRVVWGRTKQFINEERNKRCNYRKGVPKTVQRRKR